MHYKILGVPNDLILANAKRMVESREGEVIIRIPVIPGYTDSIENLQGIVDFASKIGVREVNLLPYHRLGEPKYYKLGRTYELAGQNMPTDEYCSKLLAQLERHDVALSIGG